MNPSTAGSSKTSDIESRPFDEGSSQAISSDASSMPPSPPQPQLMLAPSTPRSPDRVRTLRKSKGTPETALGGPSIDEDEEDDPEEILELFNRKSPKSDRKKMLMIVFGISVAIGLGSGLMTSSMMHKRREAKRIMNRPTHAPTMSPTASPTNTPSVSPTASLAPTDTFRPSADPSPAPSESPSAAPSSSPTASPTDAPTGSFGPLLKGLLTERYGVDVDETTNALAIEWLKGEAAREATDGLGAGLGKLIQRFALVATDLALQSATSVVDAKRPRSGVDECDWKGVGCDSEGWVEAIKWDYQIPRGLSLSGTICPELRLLAESLKVLDLSNNGMVGSIPEELYELTNLEKLYLFKNQIEGTISTRIGDLYAITHLHLSHNNLVGGIPDQVKAGEGGNRPLYYFNLYSNKLTGTLPNDLGLRRCFYFDVGRNKLTGTLPADIGDSFFDLRHLHLDHNRFVGTFPSSYNFVGNGRLESLSIDNNQLTGSIPGERRWYNKLVQWTFQSNGFVDMGSEICLMEIPFNEMVEMRADCNVCRCDGFFNICDRQCKRS